MLTYTFPVIICHFRITILVFRWLTWTWVWLFYMAFCAFPSAPFGHCLAGTVKEKHMEQLPSAWSNRHSYRQWAGCLGGYLQQYSFVCEGINASATARVTSSREIIKMKRQFHWWRKPKHLEETTDLWQATERNFTNTKIQTYFLFTTFTRP